jgi:hypothetical protein
VRLPSKSAREPCGVASETRPPNNPGPPQPNPRRDGNLFGGPRWLRSYLSPGRGRPLPLMGFWRTTGARGAEALHWTETSGSSMRGVGALRDSVRTHVAIRGTERRDRGRLLGAADRDEPRRHRPPQPLELPAHRANPELRRGRRTGRGGVPGRVRVRRFGRLQGDRRRRLHPGPVARPGAGPPARRRDRQDRPLRSRTATCTPWARSARPPRSRSVA